MFQMPDRPNHAPDMIAAVSATP